jgi:hypothetical protein
MSACKTDDSLTQSLFFHRATVCGPESWKIGARVSDASPESVSVGLLERVPQTIRRAGWREDPVAP